MVQPGGHEHTIDVPVVLGPLVLRVALLAAVCAVTGYAMLRAFLGTPSRATAATVTASAAVATFLTFMLTTGFDLPDQVAVLILATIAVPLVLAMSRTRPSAARHAERLAPWVIGIAAAAAFVEFARGAPYTGLMLALVGLSWYTLALPRWRPGSVAVQIIAAALATAAIAGAGCASVGLDRLPPTERSPRGAMSSLEVPGLDVSGRVRARDIQMAAVADVRRRVIMISGAIDAPDHDVSVSINLPEPGRWQVIKSETNVTDQTWVAMEVTTDEDSHFVKDAPADKLANAIRGVAVGRRVVDGDLAAWDSADCPLTGREIEVLRMAADGANAVDIAARLYLSAGTVRNSGRRSSASSTPATASTPSASPKKPAGSNSLLVTVVGRL